MMKAVVKVLGVQKPSDRWGKEKDAHQYPEIASWRCNLTGLSQKNNLLFVAYVGQIYVYEPRFPSQALPFDPILIIDTSPSRPGLTGSISSWRPRAISYLVVQDLGIEEIVCTAHDDGDVQAFLVAHILDAVERRRRLAGDPAEVRPFFQRNVGDSAWGLAVHSNVLRMKIRITPRHLLICSLGYV